MYCRNCGVELHLNYMLGETHCKNCGAYVESQDRRLPTSWIETAPPVELAEAFDKVVKKEFNAKSPFDRIGMSLLYENVRQDILNRSDLQTESYIILLIGMLIYGVCEVYKIQLPGVNEMASLLSMIASFVLFFLTMYVLILIVHRSTKFSDMIRMLSYPFLINTIFLLVFLQYNDTYSSLRDFAAGFFAFYIIINYLLSIFIFMPFITTLLDKNKLKSFLVFTISYFVTSSALIVYIAITSFNLS